MQASLLGNVRLASHRVCETARRVQINVDKIKKYASSLPMVPFDVGGWAILAPGRPSHHDVLPILKWIGCVGRLRWGLPIKPFMGSEIIVMNQPSV